MLKYSNTFITSLIAVLIFLICSIPKLSETDAEEFLVTNVSAGKSAHVEAQGVSVFWRLHQLITTSHIEIQRILKTAQFDYKDLLAFVETALRFLSERAECLKLKVMKGDLFIKDSMLIL